jgi:hypothetical protein
MASTNQQPKSAPHAGAILRLNDGTVCTMVKPGRQSPPLTVFVRQKGQPEREIALDDVAEVLWSP